MKTCSLRILGIPATLGFVVACNGAPSQSQFLGPSTTARSSAGMSRLTATEKVLWGFSSPNTPVASVIADTNGNLYGTLKAGGVKTGICANFGGCGGVFKLTPTGSGRYTEAVLFQFTGGSDGGGPLGNLYMDSNGALYGTTTYGGSSSCGSGCGTVFKLAPSGSTYAESTIYTFQYGTDGASPDAGLIADGAGALYGTTQSGGDDVGSFQGDGTVFKLTPKGKRYSERIIHRFKGCSIPSKGCDGASPSAPLYMNSAGDLFGTTLYGGAHQCPQGNLCGTVFEMTPNAGRYRERVIYNFQGGSDGATPHAGLIADAQGSLYGTTAQGGGATQSVCNSSGCGTVFKLTLTRSGKRYREVVLYAFQGGLDGALPQGGVVMDSSGSLYGTTSFGGYCGGCGGYGTIFEVTPAGSHNSESVLFAFRCSSSQCSGQDPEAGLIEVNGTFYGTTARGNYGTGNVFSLTP